MEVSLMSYQAEGRLDVQKTHELPGCACVTRLIASCN
jgi:hypothetical protein